MAITAEQAWRNKVLSSTGVTGYISNRLYAARAPYKAKFPFGVFTRISTVRDHALDGKADYQHMRLQVDWFGENRANLVLLAAAARAIADGFIGSVTVGSTGLTLGVCNLENEIHDIEAVEPGRETAIHRITQDWIIGHGE